VQAIRVRLWTKPDCSLCRDAEAALRRIARDVPLEVVVLGAQADGPASDRLPVLEIDGCEVGAGRISEFRVRNWLRERGYHDASR